MIGFFAGLHVEYKIMIRFFAGLHVEYKIMIRFFAGLHVEYKIMIGFFAGLPVEYKIMIVFFAGLPVEYPQLGLEARRWCSVCGRAQVGFHRSELPGSWLLNADGQPLHHEVLQTCEWCTSTLSLHHYCQQVLQVLAFSVITTPLYRSYQRQRSASVGQRSWKDLVLCSLRKNYCSLHDIKIHLNKSKLYTKHKKNHIALSLPSPCNPPPPPPPPANPSTSNSQTMKKRYVHHVPAIITTQS